MTQAPTQAQGGAETVIAALRAAEGENAILLMPTYPIRMSMLEEMRSKDIFDVTNTPSHMGKITEIFRQMPGVERSTHPTHPVAAHGPRASDYTKNHHLVGTPCGPGSPLGRLVDYGGDILCMGCLVGHATSTHIVEGLVDDFPLEVYLPGTMSKTVRFSDGHSEPVTTRVHDPVLAPIRIDNYPPKEAEIIAEMLSRGILLESGIGQGHCYLFEAADFLEMFTALAKQGRTIYATETENK